MNDQPNLIARASTINLANIIRSYESKVKHLNVFLFLKGKGFTFKKHQKEDIGISLDGEVSINGKKLDPENPPEGIEIHVEKKIHDGKREEDVSNA